MIGAYQEQCAAIEGIGGRIILMASRALAASARSSDDYARVYGRVLSQVREPVILHWLGEMFDPALAGYWVGHAHADSDHARALDVFVEIIRTNKKLQTLGLLPLANKKLIKRADWETVDGRSLFQEVAHELQFGSAISYPK